MTYTPHLRTLSPKQLWLLRGEQLDKIKRGFCPVLHDNYRALINEIDNVLNCKE